MIDEPDVLDRALDGATAPPRIGELVDLSHRLSIALAADPLPRHVRDRVWARAQDGARRPVRLRVDSLLPHRPALLGGIAVALGAAAVGVAVLRARGQRAPAVA